jgi:hypothetical protein
VGREHEKEVSTTGAGGINVCVGIGGGGLCAEAVQGVHLPGMMTSMFLGPGPLVCALPVEMLLTLPPPSSRCSTATTHERMGEGRH